MKNIRVTGKMLLLLFIVAAFASCNKGVGCPMDFSAEPIISISSLLGIF